MAGLLVIDYTIDKIIKEIQKELKVKYSKDFAYDTLVEVIEAQIDATINGMADGNSIIWKYFGSFVATKRTVDALNKKYIGMGKQPTLQDTGLVRMTFTRDGKFVNKTDLILPYNKKNSLDVPDEFKVDKEEDNA